MNETERHRLIDDGALESLRSEIRLHQVMGRSSWLSVHSHHYFDVKEEKWREMDAVASRLWVGSMSGRSIRIKIMILVESKSLREKHLLLPPIDPLKQAIIFDWLGSQRWRQERFALYTQYGLEPRTANQIDNAAFPGAADIMPDAPNLLKPPAQVDWNAAGFLELQNRHKIGGKEKEKELGSSVVWRARLGLQSASQALARIEIDAAMGDLTLAIQLARLKQMGAGEEPLDMKTEVMADLANRPPTITVFHPMIVVDADIWGVSLEEVVPINHARIHLTNLSRYPYFWFDLVKRDVVDQVLARAQAEYDLQAYEKGLRPEEPNLGVADYEIAHP